MDSETAAEVGSGSSASSPASDTSGAGSDENDGSGDESSGGTTGDGADGPVRAFPGAEGWGTETPGGRGGKVYIVDTLDWEGPGSFSEALYAPEPRIIVFEVSGVIDVGTEYSLDETQSNVTVAGQTSPGGITFRGGGATVTSYQAGFHDGVFRFMRFRGATSYDNVSLNDTHHIVFDHCDFSGGEDETLDITYSTDVTVSWSTIDNSGPGGQRYGFLLAYAPTTRISYHHNLSAHHVNRCGPHMHWGDGPAPEDGALIDIRNNVLYDCAFEQLFSISSPMGGDLKFNLVGNYGKAGPNTPPTDSVAMISMGTYPTYEADNVYDGNPVFHPWSEPILLDEPHAMPEVTTTDAETAYEDVLARSGAWPRDAMNERTIEEVRNGTGELGVVDDPLIESGPEPPPDGDRDGMPDAWEEDRGLDPTTDDSAADDDDDGWTNIEEYLHDRAMQLIGS